MTFFVPQKIEKQLAEIKEAAYRDIQPITHFKFCEGATTAAVCNEPAAPDFDDSDWADFTVGDTWGGYDVTAWFRTRAPIPEAWREQRVCLRFLVGPRDGGGSTAETMLYVNGEPLQGIDVWHEEAWLPPELLRGGEIQVALKAWSGVLEAPERRRFKLAQLILVDEASEALYQKSRVLLEAIACLDEKELRRMLLLQALDEAYGCIDFSQARSPAFYASVKTALDCLQGRLAELEGAEGDPRGPAMKPRVSAVGHAHIDLAWLWRLHHSREKAARTFTTALHLMREYPEYRFTHSSPQLFKYLKEDYPDIYARVKEHICQGKWEVTGGMWVESDVNIPDGESLVRQFLLGQQYLREEFGVTCRLLWLPDVFGYSWALPQIARQSGIDYFLTSKISWNQFNRFPYDTFRWRGIDGTELLTYFITTPSEDETHLTYNGQLSPRDVMGTWDLYNQKETNHELLTLFGWGDGGGGPTREMLESGRVLKDLPGFPTVRQELAEDFFERLAQHLPQEKLPVWDGELYLELHRGTYTSQAYNKRANRQAEILYHNAEWLSAVAAVFGHDQDLTGFGNRSGRALREGWELLLMNQFHDILPGSSIREVYEDSRRDYERIREIGEKVLGEARGRLEGGPVFATKADEVNWTNFTNKGNDEFVELEKFVAEESGGRQAVMVYNPLSWERGGIVALPFRENLEGLAVAGHASQVVREDGEEKILLEVPPVPSLGFTAYPLVESETAESGAPALTVTTQRLENEFLRLTLNDRGQLTSVWDKRHEREVLAPGERGNVLQTFVDKPLKFDAWDIDIFYQDHVREIDDLIEATVEESGPLRGVLRLRWRFLDSTITQRITLYAHSPRVDFRTDVDWQEKQILLKVAFPVAVRATRATYDIQFGSIERPTHWNTSWDYARFEVVAQKWADLSEGDYGVALLNDCKYGYDVKDHVLRLTLLKSAVRPDALADKGHHRFTYSLLPHAGDWREGDVVREGYDLNNGLFGDWIETGDWRLEIGDRRFSLVGVDAEHVMVSAVKEAEDGDGYIVRVYEYEQRRRRAVTLSFGAPLAGIEACNLLEESVADRTLQHEGNRATFAIKPYEIKSFRVWFAVARS